MGRKRIAGTIPVLQGCTGNKYYEQNNILSAKVIIHYRLWINTKTVEHRYNSL